MTSRSEGLAWSMYASGICIYTSVMSTTLISRHLCIAHLVRTLNHQSSVPPAITSMQDCSNRNVIVHILDGSKRQHEADDCHINVQPDVLFYPRCADPEPSVYTLGHDYSSQSEANGIRSDLGAMISNRTSLVLDGHIECGRACGGWSKRSGL